jgi:nuclear pore complex protein Nup93
MSLQDHYIGIDVGTGSARACIIDSTGEIKALASENIKLWQPAHGYSGSHYVSHFLLPPPISPPPKTSH